MVSETADTADGCSGYFADLSPAGLALIESKVVDRSPRVLFLLEQAQFRTALPQ